jgi:hypothetical protein
MPSNLVKRASSAAGRVARHTGRYAKDLVDEGTNIFTGATDSVGEAFSGSNVLSSAMNIVLIVYAVFIVNSMTASQLQVFDNTIMRLAVVLLILGLAVNGHHATAILLTVAFVMSVQASNRSNITKLANMAVTSNGSRETFYGCGGGSHEDDEEKKKETEHFVDEEGDSLFKELGLTNPLEESPEEVVSSTAELVSSGPEFTTSSQMDSIQNNVVANNQATEVRTWKEELGPQGLTQPSGYHGYVSVPASFVADTCVSEVNA